MRASSVGPEDIPFSRLSGSLILSPLLGSFKVVGNDEFGMNFGRLSPLTHFLVLAIICSVSNYFYGDGMAA
jgi:hypothetical protein